MSSNSDEIPKNPSEDITKSPPASQINDDEISKNSSEDISKIPVASQINDEEICTTPLKDISKIPAASWIHDREGTHAVIFDLETSSLDPVKDRIIQIAAQSWSDPEKKFNVFINPGVEIPEDASRVHGFTIGDDKKLYFNGELKATIPAKQALEEFIRFLENFEPVLLVGHNAIKFDMEFLLNEIRRHNLYDDFKSVVWGFGDTLDLFRQEMRAKKKYSHASCKLVNLARDYLGINVQRFHDALNDVDMLYQLVKKFDMNEADFSMYSKVLEPRGSASHNAWMQISNNVAENI